MLGKLEDMYLNSDEIDNEYNCFGYNAGKIRLMILCYH